MTINNTGIINGTLNIVCENDDYRNTHTGNNAFIWSVAPFFRLQLANSVVNNGCRSFGLFSFKTVTGQCTLTINGKSIVNGTLQITCGKTTTLRR